MDTSAWGEPGTTGRAVAQVAHDLRMPLALIQAHCERLAATLSDRDQLVEIDQIRDTASRMSRQVDGLVHAPEVDRDPIDVGALAGDVVARFRPLAQARGREITFDRRGAAIVLANPVDLELAIQNVIDNALRNARTAPVHVTVSAGRRYASIGVADDGPGIPESQREAVLRVRGQGAGATRGSAGLGLGVTNTVIRAHGGRVLIGEAAQGGALVTLQVPLPAPRRRWSRRGRAGAVSSRRAARAAGQSPDVPRIGGTSPGPMPATSRPARSS